MQKLTNIDLFVFEVLSEIKNSDNLSDLNIVKRKNPHVSEIKFNQSIENLIRYKKLELIDEEKQLYKIN